MRCRQIRRLLAGKNGYGLAHFSLTRPSSRRATPTFPLRGRNHIKITINYGSQPSLSDDMAGLKPLEEGGVTLRKSLSPHYYLLSANDHRQHIGGDITAIRMMLLHRGAGLGILVSWAPLLAAG